jgi:hypothetical protein
MATFLTLLPTLMPSVTAAALVIMFFMIRKQGSDMREGFNELSHRMETGFLRIYHILDDRTKDLRGETKDLDYKIGSRFKDIEKFFEQMDTKLDNGFKDIRAEMAQQGKDIRAEMAQQGKDIRNEMNAGFTEIRNEMNNGFKDIRTEMKEGFTSHSHRFEKDETRIQRLEQEQNPDTKSKSA